MRLSSSALVAIAFGEPGWQKIGKALRDTEHLFSSNLLEAEVRLQYLALAYGDDLAAEVRRGLESRRR